MRFLYKRQPPDDLRPEIQEVLQTMSSGGLVLVDLIFYSFIFALLTMPAKAGFALFGGLFMAFYITTAGFFLLFRRACAEREPINQFRK